MKISKIKQGFLNSSCVNGFLLILVTLHSCKNPLPDQDAHIRLVSEVENTAKRNLSDYENPALIRTGYLDVTLHPYNADPTGTKDATEAIQQALKDARDGRLICYLPGGKYKVSSTITGVQGTIEWDEWHFEGFADPWLRYASFEFPNVIMGPSEGKRAVLVLQDKAAGFDDPENPRPVLHFWSRMEYGNIDKSKPQPNINFNQKIIGIDIDLGNNNPGAVGIHHQGAEGSVIEDVNISAKGAFAGIQSAPGSGGGMYGVNISGGKYGFYIRNKERFRGSQPSPVIAGVKLTGQSENAILYDGRGPLTLAGAVIYGSGIRSDSPSSTKWNGALNIIDVVISIDNEDSAIISNHSIVLDNVFIEKATIAASVRNSGSVSGNKQGWLHINKSAIAGEAKSGPWTGHMIMKDDIWINQNKIEANFIHTDNEAPEDPESLIRKHRWLAGFPNGMTKGIANVRDVPYSATGDGKTDDYQAIQKAIDENETVFLPKGIYALSRPIKLKASTTLIGLGNVQTVITATADSNDFTDPDNPLPLIETVDDPDAETKLAFLKILVPVRNPCVYALCWRAGRNSLVRNVYPIREPSHPHGTSMGHPMVNIEGSGGGKWYTNVLLHWWDQGPTYQHLMVNETTEPLNFYMLEPQHGRGEHMVGMKNAQNFSIYSVKSECDYGVINIEGCRNFRIFGYAGNGSPNPMYPIITITDSHDFLLANINPQHKGKGHYGALGIARDPRNWNILKENNNKSEVRIKGIEQFALYLNNQNE
jgi:hypothetical protein